MTNRATVDVCRSWKPDLNGVAEVFHASFTEHAYPRHCHDTWTVLLIDSGTAAVDCSTIKDPHLRQSISQLHRALSEPRIDLERESLLAMIVGRIADALAGRTERCLPSSEAAEALRSVLASTRPDVGSSTASHRHRLQLTSASTTRRT